MPASEEDVVNAVEVALLSVEHPSVHEHFVSIPAIEKFHRMEVLIRIGIPMLIVNVDCSARNAEPELSAKWADANKNRRVEVRDHIDMGHWTSDDFYAYYERLADECMKRAKRFRDAQP